MLKFIKDNKDRPFFCYAPWTPPHGKFEMPETDPAAALYKDKKWPKKARVIAAMDNMIDRQVGELFALLEELDLDKKTIVFFCSDNGAEGRFEGVLDSSGPFQGFKRSMYEGGIRVPLIARWPGKIKSGRISGLPCYFPDVMPTLLDLIGMSRLLPSDVDGLSILPTLLGEASPAPQRLHGHLYWEWHQYDWGKGRFIPGGLMQGVRRGNWKVVRHKSSEPWELYDLSEDLGETNDLASRYPDLVKEIAAWVEDERTDPRPQLEPEMPPGRNYR